MNNVDYEGFIDFLFHESLEEFPFPESEFREWIFLCIEQESKTSGFINFIFCDDNYLHGINVKYLNHDTFTDIITFDYTLEYESISGDLFISIERVKENALLHKVHFMVELARVMIHGVLHLLGYKDKSEADRYSMRLKEDSYLRLIDFL